MEKSIYKLLRYPFIILMVISVVSCDFLDENPESFRTSENFFKDSTSLKTGVNGLYQSLKTMYRAYEPAIGELGTDEAIGQDVHAQFSALSAYKLSSTDQWFVSPYYNRNYYLITRANTIIERGLLLPQTKEIQRLIAESRFMRAIGYFRLVQFFGPVPLVTNEVAEVDYSLPRAPLSEIYKQIVEDLTLASAENVLPNVSTTNEPQRVSRYAVKALLGKVYLTMGTSKEAGVIDRVLGSIGKADLSYGAITESPNELYLKAKTVLAEIKNSKLFSLENKYGNVFLVDKQNKLSENMWELQFAVGDGTGSYFLKVYGMKTNTTSAESKVLTNGCGLTQIYYPYSLYTSYKAGDTRRDWNLTARRYDVSVNKTISFKPSDGPTNKSVQSWMAIVKYRFNGTDSLFTPINFTDRYNLPMNMKMIRYADVLLMLAEAELRYNNGGATQLAVDAMNEIRNRARGFDSSGKPISETLTPEFTNFTISNLTIDGIMEERKLELCFEGQRWFDLVRTGKLIEKYNEPQLSVEFKQAIITENYYLNPLPQDQLDLSTNPTGFFQNPR